MKYLLLLLLGFSYSLASITCDAKAPFVLAQPWAARNLEACAAQGQSTYQFRLAYIAENALTLKLNQTLFDHELDYFMSLFCDQSHFESFFGAGIPTTFYNVSEVKTQVYAPFLTYVVAGKFQVSYTNPVFDITVDDFWTARVNITASNQHRFRIFADPFNSNATVDGYAYGAYTNEWRIDSQGNACIARFIDISKHSEIADLIVTASTPADKLRQVGIPIWFSPNEVAHEIRV